MNTFKKVTVLFGLFLIAACGGGGGGMGSDDPSTSSSSSTHPFRISSAMESGMTYGELMGTQGTSGAIYVFDATNANAGVTLYYWCNAHSGMGNVINLIN